MDILKIVFSILLVIAGGLLVVCVMLQEGNDGGQDRSKYDSTGFAQLDTFLSMK